MVNKNNAPKTVPSKFQRQTTILMWKSYLQRQRKWRQLTLQTLFGGILYVIAVYIAHPVFMTPIQAEPVAPLSSTDILQSLDPRNLLGYAPNMSPYNEIMKDALGLLKINESLQAPTEEILNNMLYKKIQGKLLTLPVIWVIWKPKVENVWMFHIRSTEHARYKGENYTTHDKSVHLSSGFLAVQLAVSQAILNHVSPVTPNFTLNLVSMPLSPLMEAHRVRMTLSAILLCFTLAMLPPVLDTQGLVVSETRNKLKHAFRLREIGYPSIYIGWLTYASLTALPLCLLGGITLIQIFRWIHVMEGILILMAYVSLMMMFALIMAMFHSTPWIACTWSFLFTLIETYLAELLVHHEIDATHYPVIFFLHWLLPPLGLINSLHQFSLLQTGKRKMTKLSENIMIHTVSYTFLSWCFMMLLYSGILMLLQRTIGHGRAIGGQVSWKSIIFKKAEDRLKLHPILHPSIKVREKLQEVDGLVAKAVSFRNVSKSIMGTQVLNNIDLDIYRGEYTIFFTEPIQKKMLYTVENLLTGLTKPDSGTINVLGKVLEHGNNLLCTPQMMGFCHRNVTLMDDITVKEHLIIFLEISLWNETRQNILEYSQIRINKLLHECDLNVVRNERVKNLGPYYRVQLCWAIAMILEPRIIVIPEFKDSTIYRAVITDKILQYKSYITIVKLSFSSVDLEYGDRVFWFDHKTLVFGGTPAYMFFKYGRQYRLRLSLRTNSSLEDERLSELLKKVEECGGTVRAHLGLLLILKLPTTPTGAVASFVKDVTENATKYGVASLNISLPDPEELSRRAINESRKAAIHEPETYYEESKEALKAFAEQGQWTRKDTFLINHDQFKVIFWKYFMFYWNNKIVLTITLVSAVVTGMCLGLAMAYVLAEIYDQPHFTDVPAIHRSRNTAFAPQTLTVESLEQTTTLVLRVDDSVAARSVAHGYVLSHTNATEDEVKNMYYIAIARPGSMTEYLVTRAIDSPQLYVYMYAYGLGVSTDNQGQLTVQVLYSALHFDKGAAARSLARAYMALIRYYSGNLDASIEITDDPLSLDLSPWVKDVTAPPLFIQLLFILTIVHINLVPSHEYGLIRHFQSNAYNFSPAMYWLTLYACDIIFYWFLVIIMTVTMVSMMLLILPIPLSYYLDLMVIPFMLLIYGIGCIPQAYLFSLGPRKIMNTVTYAIVNIAFGETSIIAKIFYGNALDVAMNFMSLSPQFNMAYSYVKISQIFLYNYECIVFSIHNICSENTLHKCCETCGVLQDCYTEKSYFTSPEGILTEQIAIILTAFIFFILLLLVEYRLFKCLWLYVTSKYEHHEKEKEMSAGIERERADVLDKRAQLNNKPQIKLDTFGEYLLVKNVSIKRRGFYAVHNVYLGLGKGEILALSGLPGHGRVQLTNILAGLDIPSNGNVWAMSKYRLEARPYKYSQQVSMCCGRNSLPSWMSVYEALKMIAILRGVPLRYIQNEIKTLLIALNLQSQADKLVRDVVQADRTRLNFVAAVIGAPPIVILDEPTAYQKFTVRRAMYHILYQLRKRGHAIFIGSSNVESHMPVTNRLGIMVDCQIYDLDTVENLLERYSNKGYTVVVHLKDEVNVTQMFGKYFKSFIINDSSEVLVNVQIRDPDLTWPKVFEMMESLQQQNEQVYSYIVTATPLDYIYNNIICTESGLQPAKRFLSCNRLKKYFYRAKPKIHPPVAAIQNLNRFERRFNVTKLTELPWSVIFHT